MYFNVFIFILLLFRPIQLSLLSRVKNRYEYLPHDETEFSPEDLYEFPVRIYEDFLPEPKHIVSKNYYSGHDNIDIELRKTTKYSDRGFRIDKLRKMIENYENDELQRKFTEYDTDKTLRVIKNTKLFDENKNGLEVKRSSSFLEWRPTKNMTRDVTFKRRKTFASLFPTKRNTDLLTVAIKPMKRKTTFPSWLSWQTNSNVITTESTSDISILSSSQTPTALGTLEIESTKEDDSSLPSLWTKTQATTMGKSLRSQVYSCYMCGVYKKGIPINQECYQVFDSPDQRYRWRKRKYRVKCTHSPLLTYWSGRHYYAPFFRGGCFKRFLDIGTIYNERGCRIKAKWETWGTYASKRFRKLEKLLSGVEDGCVSSPHASLTPFSRAISLYARYHVCVCKKKYCNGTSISKLSNSMLLFVFTVLKL